MNGEPKLLYLFIESCDKNGKHASKDKFLNIYDMDFNLTNITEEGYNMYKGKIEKPSLFETMKEYAEILSKPFGNCRVDLYEVKRKIYFGEIAFYDGAEFNNVQPMEWDLKM